MKRPLETDELAHKKARENHETQEEQDVFFFKLGFDSISKESDLGSNVRI